MQMRKRGEGVHLARQPASQPASNWNRKSIWMKLVNKRPLNRPYSIGSPQNMNFNAIKMNIRRFMKFIICDVNSQAKNYLFVVNLPVFFLFSVFFFFFFFLFLSALWNGCLFIASTRSWWCHVQLVCLKKSP